MPLCILLLSLAGVRAEVLPELHALNDVVRLGEERGSGVHDHTAFDALLKEYVNEEGEVAVEGLSLNRAVLTKYLEELGMVKLRAYSRYEQAALLINAYNARTLLELIDRPQAETLADWPEGLRELSLRVAGHAVSLHELEHLMLRCCYADPRLPFALARGGRGDAGYPAAAFTGESLKTQLSAQARRFFSDSKRCRWQSEQGQLELCELFMHYAIDIGDEKARRALILEHLPSEMQEALRKHPEWKLVRLPFDASIVRAKEGNLR